MQRKLAFSVFMLIICGTLFSQESGASSPMPGTPEARVYFSEGTDFVVASNGQRTIYRAEDLASGSFILNRTDMIQTGTGSLVEFQIFPAAHTGGGGQAPVKAPLVKIAENTSVLYNGWNAENGCVSLVLLYGRLRVITGEGEGAYPLRVESGNTVVNIEKGDMGLDYIVQSSLLSLRTAQTKPLLRVYSFHGSAELIFYTIDGIPSQAADTFRPWIQINENETLTVEIASPLSFIERKPLEDEILTYWKVHNFKGEAPVAMPEISFPPPLITPVIADPVPAREPLPAPPDYSSFIKASRKKNTALIIGAVLTLAGAGLGGYAAYSVSTGNNDMRIYIPISAIPLGIGIVATIGGILYNPWYKTP
ncbi:MAG: hypothetical protein LBP76_03695 [Treponema sp.]|nr:hypothetical protein [Treponema sp.]